MNKKIKKKERKEKKHALSLNVKGGRMMVPFFCRTLPMLLPAVAANVKQIDSHIFCLSPSLSLSRNFFCTFSLSLKQTQHNTNMKILYLWVLVCLIRWICLCFYVTCFFLENVCKSARAGLVNHTFTPKHCLATAKILFWK